MLKIKQKKWFWNNSDNWSLDERKYFWYVEEWNFEHKEWWYFGWFESYKECKSIVEHYLTTNRILRVSCYNLEIDLRTVGIYQPIIPINATKKQIY